MAANVKGLPLADQFNDLSNLMQLRLAARHVERWLHLA